MHANDQLPPYIAAISCTLFTYSYTTYGTNSNFPPISIGAQRGTRCEPRHHRKYAHSECMLMRKNFTDEYHPIE